jgi:predicted secreted protein
MTRPVGALGLVCAAALLACATPGSARAHDDGEDTRDRVSFSVEASREVANDWATAIVGTSDEDSDAARLAGRVNETMKWALERSKRAEGIEVRSGGYQTHPVHGEKGKILRWRASQDLVLESADVDALSKLLGDLQGRLLLRSISFSVSPESRRAAEDALIADALAAFARRAKRVQESLGARDHSLVSLGIRTQGGSPPPQPYARDMVMMEQAAVAPPSFEGGQSTLEVHVDATIELER